MEVELTVDGKDVAFVRSWFTGRAEITFDGMTFTLQSPMDVETHFSFKLQETWTAYVGRRVLTIEHKRPLFFGGLLPHNYRFLVDGRLIDERSGY